MPEVQALSTEQSKAFDFAQETTKQLLTLATGILALTLTFLKDIVSGAPTGTRHWLEWGWGVYIISIVFGLLTLMSLSGNLERPTMTKTRDSSGKKVKVGDKEQEEWRSSIYCGSIRFFATLQDMTFLVATILVVIFGIKAT